MRLHTASLFSHLFTYSYFTKYLRVPRGSSVFTNPAKHFTSVECSLRGECKLSFRLYLIYIHWVTEIYTQTIRRADAQVLHAKFNKRRNRSEKEIYNMWETEYLLSLISVRYRCKVNYKNEKSVINYEFWICWLLVPSEIVGTIFKTSSNPSSSG